MDNTEIEYPVDLEFYLRGYKFRLYPNAKQREYFDKCFSVARYVYNWAINRSKEHYEDALKKMETITDEVEKKKIKKTLSYFDLAKELTPLKKNNIWLKDVSAMVLLYAAQNFTRARDAFFKKRGRMPVYKSRFDLQKSFTENSSLRIDFDKKLLNISRMPAIKIVPHLKFDGKLKQCTVSMDSKGKYYASLIVEESKLAVEPKPITVESSMGLKIGVKNLITTNKGETFENPKYLEKNIDRISLLQKRSKRCSKDTIIKNKLRLKIATIHEKTKINRTHFQFNVIKKLMDKADVDTFFVDETTVRQQMENNKNKKNKKNNLIIADAACNIFLKKIEYKSKWNGKNFKKITLANKHQMFCKECLSVYDELDTIKIEWTCPKCGCKNQSRTSLALKILNEGIKNIKH